MQQLDVNHMVDAVLDAVAVPLTAFAERIKALEAQQPAKGDKGDPGQPGERGEPGQSGRDGAGLAAAVIDRDGELVVTMTDGSARLLGPVLGRDGRRGEDGANGSDGNDGRDGFGFDDLTVEHDGNRTVILRFARDGHAREFSLCFPMQIYRGVFSQGDRYQHGDLVTWGGSVWHCNTDTDEKPGEATKAWTLAVKRGRDGKNGKDGEKGERGLPGKDSSRDLVHANGEPGARSW